MTDRRQFLRTAGMTIGLLGMAPAWLARAAAQGSPRRKILISIFQRGAADGLNMVVPFFEKRYYELRPSIAIAPPKGIAFPVATPAATSAASLAAALVNSGNINANSNLSIDLDGRFALHPQLQALKPLWDGNQLAIVHAAGSPDNSRSHFDAQEFMESGTASTKTNDGWLNRTLGSSADTSPLRAVALGKELPRALRGRSAAVPVAVDDLAKFQMANPDAAAMFESMYAASGDSALKTQGHGTFEAVRMIESVLKQPYTPVGGAQYIGDFGKKLRQLAQLIKANVGVEVAFADMNNWDHHANENSQLPTMLNEFGSSLAAFSRDMGDRMEDIVMVTMSEFGRTAAESGNQGTDHGHGGVMLVLGGTVKGGNMYGRWPGLQPEQLFEGRDLAVTTDYRDVLGELVRDHLGVKPDAVFPGFSVGAPLGLVRA
jgi:uncharacterized protein (DUF1501 family)